MKLSGFKDIVDSIVSLIDQDDITQNNATKRRLKTFEEDVLQNIDYSEESAFNDALEVFSLKVPNLKKYIVNIANKNKLKPGNAYEDFYDNIEKLVELVENQHSLSELKEDLQKVIEEQREKEELRAKVEKLPNDLSKSKEAHDDLSAHLKKSLENKGSDDLEEEKETPLSPVVEKESEEGEGHDHCKGTFSSFFSLKHRDQEGRDVFALLKDALTLDLAKVPDGDTPGLLGMQKDLVAKTRAQALASGDFVEYKEAKRVESAGKTFITWRLGGDASKDIIYEMQGNKVVNVTYASDKTNAILFFDPDPHTQQGAAVIGIDGDHSHSKGDKRTAPKVSLKQRSKHNHGHHATAAPHHHHAASGCAGHAA